MSDIIGTIRTSDRKCIQIGTFAGGAGRGRCVQLTISPPTSGYAQLTATEVEMLVEALRTFLEQYGPGHQ